MDANRSMYGASAQAAGTQQSIPREQWWCHTCRAVYYPVVEKFGCTVCGEGFVESLVQQEEGMASTDAPQNYYVPGDVGIQRNNNTTTTNAGSTAPIPPTPTPTPPPPVNNNYSYYYNRSSAVPPPPPPPVINVFNMFNQFLGQPFVNMNLNVNGRRHVVRTSDPFDFINRMFGIQGMGPMMGNSGDYVFGNMDEILNRIFQQYDKKGPPPASKTVLQSLKPINISKEEIEKHKECTVCKGDYEENEVGLQLPCSHLFHENCVRTWLEMHNTCPVCRYELPTDDPDYEHAKQLRREHQRQQQEQQPNTTTTTNTTPTTNTSTASPSSPIPINNSIPTNELSASSNQLQADVDSNLSTSPPNSQT